MPSYGQVFIWGRGSSWVVKSQSAKFWPSFHFFIGGVVKTQSAKFWPSFHWGGRGYSLVVQMRIGILGKMSKIFAMLYSGSPCIADSLSHTMCVETNNESLKSD